MKTDLPQPGILAPLPTHARYLEFDLQAAGQEPAALGTALDTLANLCAGLDAVVGIGPPVCAALGVQVPGLHAFAGVKDSRVELPDTPRALWLWLRGTDPGTLLMQERRVQGQLMPCFVLAHALAAFVHAGGRDLTGYEDGTENPTGEAAIATALQAGFGPGIDGGSLVAVQRWVHNFNAFDAHSREEQDLMVGRRRADNEEIDDAPASAHVRRTAQEDFDPEAFVVRRSMPWIEGSDGGLMFVAFSARLDAFEAQLRRMSGAEDGVVDALFRFSRPDSTFYAWCPPQHLGRIDLRQLGRPHPHAQSAL